MSTTCSTLTKETFKSLSTAQGEVYLLISGSFRESALNPVSISAGTSTGEWNIGTWFTNNVGNLLTGSMDNGSLVGILFSLNDVSGQDTNTYLRRCDTVALTLNIGTDDSNTLILPILNKNFTNSGIFFEVSSSLEPFRGLGIQFESTGSSSPISVNYSSTGSNNVTFTLTPFYSLYENSAFNPLIDNATDIETNTYTKKVEYVGSKWIITTAAEIPDSFYTEYKNISGRFLGTRNNYVPDFIDGKANFLEKNLEFVSQSNDTSTFSTIETGKGRSFYNISSFKGSVFVSSSANTAIAEMNLSDMEIQELAYVPAAILIESGSSYYSVKQNKRSEYNNVCLYGESPIWTSLAKATSSLGTGSSGDIISESFDKTGMVVTKMSSLPKLGDILFNNMDLEHRIVDSKVYIPDLNKIAYTDTYGHIRSFEDSVKN